MSGSDAVGAVLVEKVRVLTTRFEDLKRERDEALNELLTIRTLIAGACLEHQGQGLPDLVRGIIQECERRTEGWELSIRTIAAMQDGRGPVRRVAKSE